VDKAIDNGSLAFELFDQSGSLALGYHIIGNTKKTIVKTIRLQNTNSTSRTYTLTPTFRDAADAALGAVQVVAPASVTLSGGAIRDINVRFIIDGSKLPAWSLTQAAGATGNDGTVLNSPELDGYFVINGGANDKITMPWQVLPHKGANTTSGRFEQVKKPGQNLNFTNKGGAVAGGVEVFNLLESNGILPTTPPGPGDNFAQIDLKAFGVRDAGSSLQFAISTYGGRATPNYPAEFDIYLDTDNNGTADYVAFNAELGLTIAGDGRNVVYVQKLGTTTATAFFFTIVDYNSSNLIFTVPKAAIGVANGQKVGAQLFAFDNYFTGFLTDQIRGNVGDPGFNFSTFTVNQPRYSLNISGTPTSFFTVAPGATVTTNISEAAGGENLSNGVGIMLQYLHKNTNTESELIYLNFGS
jgi:minor extracellular serine protease Vpr